MQMPGGENVVRIYETDIFENGASSCVLIIETHLKLSNHSKGFDEAALALLIKWATEALYASVDADRFVIVSVLAAEPTRPLSIDFDESGSFPFKPEG